MSECPRACQASTSSLVGATGAAAAGAAGVACASAAAAAALASAAAAARACCAITAGPVKPCCQAARALLAATAQVAGSIGDSIKQSVRVGELLSAAFRVSHGPEADFKSTPQQGVLVQLLEVGVAKDAVAAHMRGSPALP